MPPPCSVEDCERPRRNNTSPYCETHYTRIRRHGSPDVVMKDHRPFEKRWRDSVAFGDCWLWIGTVNHHGYGVASQGYGKIIQAHREVYRLLVGPIPVDLELDHLCRARHCVNPDHLEPVTHAENVRRGEAGIKNSSKTHCVNGHEFTPDNTYRHKNGGRQCRTCQRVANAKSQRAKRGTAPDAVHNRDKTHCKHGHEFDEANTRLTKRGQRVCKVCERNAQRRYQARKRAEAAASE